MTYRTYPGAGILAVRDGKVLMVLHYRGGKYRWELPSGFVLPSETLEEAAVRETQEEAGVTVTVGDLLCTVVMDVPNEEYRGINAYFWASSVGDETPKFQGCDNEPIIDAAYIDLQQIKPRELHPVDRKILSRWLRKPQQRPYYFRMVFD